jgi:hypothetical protein
MTQEEVDRRIARLIREGRMPSYEDVIRTLVEISLTVALPAEGKDRLSCAGRGSTRGCGAARAGRPALSCRASKVCALSFCFFLPWSSASASWRAAIWTG